MVELSPEGSEYADLSTNTDEFFVAQARDRGQVRDAKPITITIAATGSEPQPDIALVLRAVWSTELHAGVGLMLKRLAAPA